MIVWSADEVSTPRSTMTRPARAESPDPLAEAKSWGFGHDIGQPRPAFVAAMLSLRLSSPDCHRRLVLAVS